MCQFLLSHLSSVTITLIIVTALELHMRGTKRRLGDFVSSLLVFGITCLVTRI